MAAITESTKPSPLSPSVFLFTLGAALVVSLAILAAGERALYLILGVLLMPVYLKQPVWGLYVTTVLLLLSGIALPLGGLRLGLPSIAAKASGVAAIGAWGLNYFATGKRFRLGLDTWLVLGFLAWALVGIGYSLIWRIQLPEWVRLLTVVGYFLLAIHVLDTPERLHRFVMILVWCAAILSAFALFQYLTPSLQYAGPAGIGAIGAGQDVAFIDPEGLVGGAAVRVTGGTGHSNWLAFTLLLVLPLNVYWFKVASTRRGKAVVVAAVVLELIALVLTFTRLGLLVGVGIGVFLVLTRLVKLTPHRLSALGVAVVLCWFVLPGAYKERVIDFTQYARSESTRARVEVQQYAWAYMQDFPTYGIGLAGFGPRFHEERNSEIAGMLRWMVKYQGWNPIYYGPHNMYLQIGSELGAVGLILFLLFIARAIYSAKSAEKVFRAGYHDDFATLASCVGVSIIAFVFCAIFLHALQQKIWWMIFAAAIALPFCASRVQPADIAEGD
ncbi:MAG: hypothetical protein AMXMBFR4_08830 [Candidatus Hydrogenedentota bacterium]